MSFTLKNSSIPEVPSVEKSSTMITSQLGAYRLILRSRRQRSEWEFFVGMTIDTFILSSYCILFQGRLR